MMTTMTMSWCLPLLPHTWALWLPGAARCGAPAGTTRRTLATEGSIPFTIRAIPRMDTAPGTTLGRVRMAEGWRPTDLTAEPVSRLATILRQERTRAQRRPTGLTALALPGQLSTRAPEPMRQHDRDRTFTEAGDRPESRVVTSGRRHRASPTMLRGIQPASRKAAAAVPRSAEPGRAVVDLSPRAQAAMCMQAVMVT